MAARCPATRMNARRPARSKCSNSPIGFQLPTPNSQLPNSPTPNSQLPTPNCPTASHPAGDQPGPPASSRRDIVLRVRFRPILGAAIVLAATAGALAQGRADLPQALTQMIEAERAFAARALVIGWKEAFLEFFAADAVGFNDGVGLARDQIRANPDPPKDLQLIWEPRYGDIAASGELGYLTGPVRSILPSRNNGRPRHSMYASIWKRQRDGTFKVVMDVGVDTPSAVTFAPGFTRAAIANRFTGDYDETTPPLSTADGVLNSDLRTSQASAYRGRLSAGARFHRPGILPVVGERNATRWLARSPPTRRPTRAMPRPRGRETSATRGAPTRSAGSRSRSSRVFTCASGTGSVMDNGRSRWTSCSRGSGTIGVL
jgi:hypothetical protein